MTCPVPLARKIVLQVAVRDIGQLTDICEQQRNLRRRSDGYGVDVRVIVDHCIPYQGFSDPRSSA
jgi:hypothetical protein